MATGYESSQADRRGGDSLVSDGCVLNSAESSDEKMMRSDASEGR